MPIVLWIESASDIEPLERMVANARFPEQSLRAKSEIGRTMLRAAATRECGFALLLVIWILALLAVIAAGIAADSRSALTVAQSRMELARARSLAEAGVTLAIAGLIVPDPALRWRADGSSRTVLYGSGTIAITVQDEGGKIDLNRAPMELIAGLLDELGVASADGRDALLRGIADQRTAASDRAPASDAGIGILPRRRRSATSTDAAFATVSELRQLGGVTRSAYDRIRPFVTVYSQAVTINPQTAPREVLAAVPGVTSQTVDFYIAAREAHPAGQPTADLLSLGAAATKYLAANELGTVTITATAEIETGISFGREAVVALAGASEGPFTILEWHQRLEPTDTTKRQAE
jgi:general secretion pathway protein K